MTTPQQPTPPPATTTVDDRLKERADEYGTYVASTDILLDGVRAFNTGDAVPVSHVTGGVVEEWQVHKITTKAGRVAAGLETEK